MFNVMVPWMLKGAIHVNHKVSFTFFEVALQCSLDHINLIECSVFLEGQINHCMFTVPCVSVNVTDLIYSFILNAAYAICSG